MRPKVRARRRLQASLLAHLSCFLRARSETRMVHCITITAFACSVLRPPLACMRAIIVIIRAADTLPASFIWWRNCFPNLKLVREGGVILFIKDAVRHLINTALQRGLGAFHRTTDRRSREHPLERSMGPSRK